MTAFKGEAKAVKLFAKHIKVREKTVHFDACFCKHWYVLPGQYSLNVCVWSVQIEEQVKLLQKGVTHVGVGTPGRISALIEKGRCEYVLI